MEMCNPTSGSCITGDTTLLGPFSDQQHDPSWLPPGFRFHPTDDELVTFYLAHKIQNPNFSDRAIAEADLNRSEPWELPAQAKMGEKEWYFYSSRDRKYPTGMRTNRATHAGYWKATGKDREVVCSRTQELVGMKKTLVFYRGRAPRGIKTNWVMHEYRTEPDIVSSRVLAPHTGMKARPGKDEWVVCRVFHKSAGGKKMHLTELKQSNALFSGGRTGELVDAGGAGSISKLIGETLPALMELPCASSGFGTQFWQMMQSSPDWGQPRQAFFSGGLTSNAVPQSTLQHDLGNLSFPPHPSCASDVGARNPNLALLHNTQCRSDNSSFLSVETTNTQHMSTTTDGPGVGFLDHATLKAIFDRYQSGGHGEVKVEPGVNMYSYSKEQESSMEAHQAGTGVSLEGSSSSSTCAGSGAARMGVRAMESLKSVQQQHHQASMASLKNLQQLSPASDFSCTYNSSAISNYKALSDLESLYWSFAQHIPPH